VRTEVSHADDTPAPRQGAVSMFRLRTFSTWHLMALFTGTWAVMYFFMG